MTMQSNNDDKGLKFQLDTQTDDAAFDDTSLDEELDDSMGTTLPHARQSRSKAKLMAGVVLVALLGIGGYVGYQKMSSDGAVAPTAAIPGDVPATTAATDPMATQPLPGPDGLASVPMDGSAPPVDPMLAGQMPPADGSVAPVPMDGGAPLDPALDPAMAGIAPPPAPGVPDAVMGDSAIAPPADPMLAGQPIDGGVVPIDPMAQLGGVPPAEGVNAPIPNQPLVDTAPSAATSIDAAPPAQVVETIQPASVVPAVDPAATQEMREKIQTLEGRIAELDREVSGLRKQQSETTATGAAEVTAADLKALERRIDALAAKSASAAATSAAGKAWIAPTPSAPKPSVVTSAPVATDAARNTTMQAPATATIRTAIGAANGEAGISAPPPRAPTVAVPSAAPMTAPATARKTTTWQLRSAQPGRATLSQPGSQEMRNVGVGDEVPGLGRILSIAQGSDGRWVVRGSMGSAAQ